MLWREFYVKKSRFTDSQIIAIFACQATGAMPLDRDACRAHHAHMTADIFISYRRQDAAAFAARLRDRLESSFPGQVFLDVSAIAGGTVFPPLLSQAVRGARVLIVVISPSWRGNRDGTTQLGDADDFVTQELITALRAGIAVIPVLTDGCGMPRPDDLPADLRPLASHAALAISHERFESDVTHLIAALYAPLGIAPPGRIERVLEAAGGGTRVNAHTRDRSALGALVVALIAALLCWQWLLDTRADPREGWHVLVTGALGLLLAWVGRHSVARRKLALAALALSAAVVLGFLGAGAWRVLSTPLEPWMVSGQVAALHRHLPELPEARVHWTTREPFSTPPPSVHCDCLTLSAPPTPSLPYPDTARHALRNTCSHDVVFVLARITDERTAAFHPWFAGRGREFAVVTLAPSQAVSVSSAGAWRMAVQPWICGPAAPRTPPSG